MQSPLRPYVPHRTPARAQPAIAAADFALSRPFVPGADPVQASMASAAAQVSHVEALAPIDNFLAEPRSSAPVHLPTEFAAEDEFAEEPDELPPLEHFLDPLPVISEFSAGDAAPARGGVGEWPDRSADAPSKATADSDWVETDWQRYDWQSVASLGEADRASAEASSAWATTDWDIPSPRQADRTSRPPADAIAVALDQIAQRIRNGDLPLPGDGSVDPATIAATLAALLGVRR